MVEPLGGIQFSWPFGLALLIGYLFGSLPTGLFVTRFAGLGDIRKIGSGNIGSTNVLRTGRKDLALITLIGDVLKGAVPVWFGWRFGQDIAVLAALGAVFGHCFPIWLKFRGGKAVATGGGALIMLSWPIGVVTIIAWLIIAFATRLSSLAALVAVTVATITAWILANYPLGEHYYSDVQRFQAVALIGLLIIVRHHANIRRLLTGQEPRFGAPTPPTEK